MRGTVGEATLGKLQRICKVGVWVAIIAIVIVALALSVSIAGVAMCYIDPHYHQDPMDHRGTLIHMFCNVLTLCACLWACMLAYELLRSVKEGSSPFIPENVERMKDIAVTIGSTFVALIVLQLILIAILDPHSYVFDIPVHMLIAALVTTVFTLLFEYGTALQTESDEFL